MSQDSSNEIIELPRRHPPEAGWSLMTRSPRVTQIYQAFSSQGALFSWDVADGDWIVVSPAGPQHLNDQQFRQSYDATPETWPWLVNSEA